MSLPKFLDLIKLMDQFICKKTTGTTKELARKLHISRSTATRHIQKMKQMGFPIKYSREQRSFYYDEEGQMNAHLFEKKLSDDELKKITGGRMLTSPVEFFQFASS